MSLQSIELLLPTPGLALRGTVDVGIWPGGVQEQFKVALPMVQAVLQTVSLCAWGGPDRHAVLQTVRHASPPY